MEDFHILVVQLEDLRVECQALIDSLYHEIGKERMTLELRLQLEKLEDLLRS
jgi:hypothetical protein